MQDFFNKAGKVAKNTAGRAADKAGDLVEIGKLKAKISSAKAEISSKEKKIGQYYFEQYMEGTAVDAAVGAMCEEIKAQKELIEELEEKIQDVKEV
ncbi:hypothetical protein LI177_01050 [bacterium 210820-DFI.6.37]|nr:hypothetical protein [bacterium 210820-DFI.6.37]